MFFVEKRSTLKSKCRLTEFMILNIMLSLYSMFCIVHIEIWKVQFENNFSFPVSLDWFYCTLLCKKGKCNFIFFFVKSDIKHLTISKANMFSSEFRFQKIESNTFWIMPSVWNPKTIKKSNCRNIIYEDFGVFL